MEAFQREHAAAEHAGYPGTVGQHLGQPVAGARVDSWVTHNIPVHLLEGSQQVGDSARDLR